MSHEQTPLPDYYQCVVHDVIEMCDPLEGLWVDLGCGQGPLAFALADISESPIILVDPAQNSLAKAAQKARSRGLYQRLVPVRGRAEDLPLADNSVDLVVSRGSIFFWEDQPAGLKEIHRVLRTDGRAMIGGGLGNTYPTWARREFIRRRREQQREKGPEALRAFKKLRQPATFRRWATEAELTNFQVVGEGGLPADDPDTGLGIWLLFGR